MALGFNFRYYIISLGFLPFILNQTTDTELFYCVDWNCEEFISRGKTLLNYNGKTDRHLSFRQNEDIKILGKPVDVNSPDWVGTVRKKIGLVPKSMVREDQIGKRSAGFKYPFNQLPLWPQPGETNDSLLEEGNNNIDTNLELESSSSNISSSGEISNPDPEEDTNQIQNDTEVNSSIVGPDPVIDILAPSSIITTTESAPTVHDEQQDEKNEPGEEVDVDLEQEIEPPPSSADKISNQVYDASQDLNDTDVKLNDSIIIDENSKIKEDVVAAAHAVPLEVKPLNETTNKEIETASLFQPPEENHMDIDKGSTVSPILVIDIPTTTTESSSVDEVVEQLDEKNEPVKEVDNVDLEQETGATDPTEILENEINKPVDDIPEEKAIKIDVKDEIKEGIADQQIIDTRAKPLSSDANNFENVLISTTTTAQPIEDVPPIKEEVVADAVPLEEKVKPLNETTNKEIETASLFQPPEENHMDIDKGSTASPILVIDIPTTTTESSSVDEVVEQLDEKIEPVEEADNIDLEQETGATDPTEILENEINKPVEDIPEEKEIKIDVKEETQIPAINEGISDQQITDTHAKPLSSDANNFENVFISTTTTAQPIEDVPPAEEIAHKDDDEHDHHYHDHHHEKPKDTSSFIIIVKHLSSTLLSFLPEHLQDTILDVDDALVFTGIIALTLVSICVPYFLIEGFFSVRPLKKKVVELNKSLWKVSTAYENQQEEFEQYKKKALAYDEDKKRVEQLEYELVLLKKLEGKQKEQVVKYQKELKNHKELTLDMQTFLDKEVEKKRKILEEKEKLKTTVTSLKEALRRTVDDLQDTQTQSSSTIMELELERQTNETLQMKVGMLESEVNELKNKFLTEVDRRRSADNERDEIEKIKSAVEQELINLKQICHQYETTVSALNTEISNKENELLALQETLGEDSPLMDIAEMKAKLLNAEELISSLQHRLESTTLENTSLSRNLKEATGSLSSVQAEKDETANRLVVLEAWFKEKEEDLRRAVQRYEAEKNIRGKDKDELVQMLEDKGEENRLLHNKFEEFKVEFEETKLQHRNEIRAMETKSHEHWLSLCQAERKAQDARKEAEMLRQKLTAITREKENEGVNGDASSTAMYPLITPDMVPIPLPDDSLGGVPPSYFGLGDGFIPPPPLPLDEEDRGEVHRPAPLGLEDPFRGSGGGRDYSDLDDPMLSPIRGGDRDYSDGGHSSASDSPRRHSPRGWSSSSQRDRHRNNNNNHRDRRERDLMEERQHTNNTNTNNNRDNRDRDRRTGPVNTSSPIQGFNL